MPRKASTFIPDPDSPFHAGKLKTNTAYGKAGESIGEIMARMHAANTRNDTMECNVVSAYPSRRRTTSFIDESPTKKNRTIRRVSSSWRKNSSPDWLVNPENYRCTECHRYCSDTFLVNNVCGYCRGEY